MDIESKWKALLKAHDQASYLQFFDTRNLVHYHLMTQIGLWFRWDVVAQNWIALTGTPPATAVLLTVAENL